MTDPNKFARQLQANLELLRAAGVLFVPRGAPLLPGTAAPTSEQLPGHESPRLPIQVDPLAERRRELTVLAEAIAACDRCNDLYSTRTQTVFGIGPVDPDVAFVGEAPGADEDRLGEPFVGKAGQLLTRIIVASGFRREEVYIFNTLKCRPPGNRTPTTEECANCRPFFERQFDLIRPRFLVALGGTAAKALLQTMTGITRLRGKVYDYRGVPLICTFHPSALLRDDSGKMKRDVWEDMKLLLRTMNRPIPDVKKG